MNASGRPNTCKSNGNSSFGKLTSGARVRNAYATHPLLGDMPAKAGAIPHSSIRSIDQMDKASVVMDGHASH